MIDIKPASIYDMPDVAELHIKCFPNSFSSCLKKNLLSCYYRSFFEDYPDFFRIAIDNDKVIGFVMGYPIKKGSSIKTFKKRYFFRCAFRILFQIMKLDGRAWKYVFKHFKKKKYVPILNIESLSLDSGGDLLSICVSPNYRKLGIASKLESDFCSMLIKNGMNYCSLTSLDDNFVANNFYQKQGYLLIFKENNNLKWIKKIK